MADARQRLPRLLRLLRGGSYLTQPWSCRSTYRNLVQPDHAIDDVGFRVVCRDPAGHALQLEETQ